MDTLKALVKDIFSIRYLYELIPILKHNLFSPIELLRVSTLEVLSKFEQPPYLTTEEGQPAKTSKVRIFH